MAAIPARLAPETPFPGYAYVPGRWPHPTSDPAGHSYGVAASAPTPVDPEAWRDCQPYLYGIDLFNAGYYWESHVAWESLWLACGRRGVVADFLKALIKLAAAGVKGLQGQPDGVRSHSGRATSLLRDVLQNGRDELMGFRVADLIELAKTIRDRGWPVEAPCLWPDGA